MNRYCSAKRGAVTYRMGNRYRNSRYDGFSPLQTYMQKDRRMPLHHVKRAIRKPER